MKVLVSGEVKIKKTILVRPFVSKGYAVLNMFYSIHLQIFGYAVLPKLLRIRLRVQNLRLRTSAHAKFSQMNPMGLLVI
jgi:hypothetical protein